MIFIQFLCVKKLLNLSGLHLLKNPRLTKIVRNNHPRKSINSDEWTGIFRPITTQFTVIKTDQNANVKWGVRFYRD